MVRRNAQSRETRPSRKTRPSLQTCLALATRSSLATWGARWLVAFLSVLFVAVCCRGQADELPPNILLIVADDLGFSDLGCYGGEIETPNLDALAADGLRFTRFYNTGRCCPSRASILTGHYPHRVGLGHMTQDIGRPGYRGRVASDAKTLAQHLSSNSYRCFLSGKWHLGTDDPTRHGFEEFYGTLVSAKTFWDPDHFLRLPPNRVRRQYSAESFYGTDAVTDHAIEFLSLAQKTPSRPWFLYLAYNAPHFPLQARRSDIAKYAERYHVGWDKIREQRLARMKELGVVDPDTTLSPRSTYANYGQTDQGVNPAWKDVPEPRRRDLARRMAIYAAMVDAMDQNIGRVLATIKSQGQRDSTLVVFLSDNGACAEWDPWGFDIKSSPNNILHRDAEIDRMGGPGTFHSVGSGWANASNTPWRLYKHYNHEGGIRSPCIVSWPSRVRRGGEIESTPAHVIDLVPTILEVAASEDVPGIGRRGIDRRGIGRGTLPGVSLMPLLDRHRLADRQLFFEHEGNRAVIDGSWKLVATRGNDWELYDFTRDPTELRDLADEHPDRVALLEAAWDHWAAENHVTPLPSDYQVDYLRRP